MNSLMLMVDLPIKQMENHMIVCLESPRSGIQTLPLNLENLLFMTEGSVIQVVYSNA